MAHKRGIRAPKAAVAQARSKARSNRTMLNKKQVAEVVGKPPCPKTTFNKGVFSRARHSAEGVGKLWCPKAMFNKNAFSKARHSAVVALDNSKVACNRAMFSKHRFSHRRAIG